MTESTKLERQQRDQINRINKLVPGLQRVYELENIVIRLEADAETIDFPDDDTADSYRADILFLNRLAWDLMEMRHALYPNQRHNNRYDAGEMPRRPRP